MKLSLRWYSTNYSKDLHAYYYILSKSMMQVSVNLIYLLVNQQRQINNCVFRLFDLSKYLTTLRSNISICQKAKTLILIPLYSMSFYL